MVTEIKMPEIGIEEVEITQILVNVGEKVKIDQPIIIVEGEKASVEIPSPCSGVIESIEVKVGEKILKDSIILKITESNSSYILKNEIKKPICNAFRNKEEEHVFVEKNVSFISSAEEEKISLEENDNFNECITKNSIHASPSVRKFAREFGVNLSKVKSSGRKGRILKEDIKSYIISIIQNHSSVEKFCDEKKKIFLSDKKLDFQEFGNIKIKKLNKIQKITGSTLHKNWISIPHVTQFDEVDITELEYFRKKQNIEIQKESIDTKITLLSFVIKSVSQGLEKFSNFNSSFIEKNQELVLKEYINIGIAVDTKDGLVVAVIRDANQKSIMELSKEVFLLSQKARSRNLLPSEMQGGCFTISSLGNIGGTSFTPIINAPEVAILGISQIVTKPIWKNDKFVPRLILPLSLSYDHRVINGADGVRFIQYIKNLMSDMRFLIM